jgi:hypothetical protein
LICKHLGTISKRRVLIGIARAECLGSPGEPVRRNPAWLIEEGMMRYSIMASSSVGRGEPVFDISWGVRLTKGHA